MATQRTWRTTYTPGSWVVLNGPRALVAAHPTTPDAAGRLTSAWADVVAATDLDSLVERLMHWGIDVVPDLIVVVDDDALRCVVRGSVVVRDAATGDVVADGRGKTAWRTETLTTRHITAKLSNTVEGDWRLPLAVGVVAASSLDIDATDDARVDIGEGLSFPVAEEVAEPEPEPAAAPPEPEESLIEPEETLVEPAEPVVEPEAPPEPEAAVAETGELPAVQEPVVEEPEAEQVAEPAPQPADRIPDEVDEKFDAFWGSEQEEPQPQEIVVEAPGEVVAEPVPEVADVDADAEPVEAPADEPVAAGVEEALGCFGATGSAAGEESLDGDVAAAPFVPAFVPNAEASEELSVPISPEAVDDEGRFVKEFVPTDQIPVPEVSETMPEVPAPEPVEMPPVDSSPLPSWPSETAEPAVDAEPEAGTDAVEWWQPGPPEAVPTPEFAPEPAVDVAPAQAEVPAQFDLPQPEAVAPQPVAEAEPAATGSPVGATLLVFSDGQRYPVDEPLLVGRAPQAYPGETARLVRVVSPNHDISRTHVRIELYDGAMWATDRESTNGTIVHNPGQEPITARPGEPVHVWVGGMIDIGEGVSIRVQ